MLNRLINESPILEKVMLKSNDKTPFIQKPVNSFFSFTETSYVKNQPIFSIHRVKKVEKWKMMKKLTKLKVLKIIVKNRPPL